MSIPIRKIRDRVRERLRDTDQRQPAFYLPEYDAAVCDAYLALAAKLPAPELYTANAFTIAAGGNTFSLPVSVTQEYAGDVRIQLVSTMGFLRKVSLEQADALRSGVPSTYLTIPYAFCLWEEKDQTVRGRCIPATRDAQACHLYQSLTVTDLRDFVMDGGTDMEDVAVRFSRIGAMALVLYAAADLLGRLTAEEAARLKLNQSVVSAWRMEAEALLYQEAGRRHDLEDTGEVQRWVP